jgi:CheY-like chemotaxis protein
MSKPVSYYSIDITDLAEGSPDSTESREPTSPLKTATVPAVEAANSKTAPAGETGTLSAIDGSPEGKGKNELQDASLRHDAAPATEKAPDTKALATPSVLIVEDTMELAEVIQATLERMNMVTAIETHGSKAIARYHEMQPDVVLLDISLPDIPGWKILDVIKETHDQNPSKKLPIVIVITAYGDPANRLVGKLQGIYSYLIKPFTADEVERAVTGALGSAAG